MRRLLWICACVLVAKAGCVATAAAYDKNELISYIRYVLCTKQLYYFAVCPDAALSFDIP